MPRKTAAAAADTAAAEPKKTGVKEIDAKLDGTAEHTLPPAELELLKAYRAHLQRVEPRFTDAFFDRFQAPPYLSGPKHVDNPTVYRALVRAIVYQQLAGKAAATIYRRFVELFPAEKVAENCPLPEAVTKMSIEELRKAGLSERKASYIQGLASYMLTEKDELAKLSDQDLQERLLKLRGIGPWSAQVLMMFTLHRLDSCPAGDLALQKGVMLFLGLRSKPSAKEVETLVAKWAPYRSVAAWYMYNMYLRSESRDPVQMKSTTNTSFTKSSATGADACAMAHQGPAATESRGRKVKLETRDDAPAKARERSRSRSAVEPAKATKAEAADVPAPAKRGARTSDKAATAEASAPAKRGARANDPPVTRKRVAARA